MTDRFRAWWWLPAALLAPRLVWIALNRSPWAWDHAWFGAHTVTLYETLRHDVLAWPAALVHATPSKPPLVTWIGEFFIPLSAITGGVDSALLLSVWGCQVATVMVVWRAALELCGGQVRIALLACLVGAAAPICAFLSTQYLAESSQMLAVAWFTLIMARAPRWPRSLLGAHLVAGASFAMLAKTTSPLFCLLPGLIGLVALFRRSPAATPEARRPHVGPWWALAAVLAVGAVAWYAVNLATALHHVRVASLSPVSEFYGHRDTFFGGFVEWWRIAVRAFLLPPAAMPVGVLAVVALAKTLRSGRSESPRYLDLCAAVALVQIGIALAVFSLSPVRDARYAAPLMPLVAVIVCWAAVRSAVLWAAPLLMVALAVQLVAVHTEALGVWARRPGALTVGYHGELTVVDRDPGPAATLSAIVQRTCGAGGFGSDNFVGVDLLHLSGHTLTYAAAKERLAGRAGECRYASIGFDSVEAARAEIRGRRYVYWIAVDPKVYPIPPYMEFGNRSAPLVFRRLRRRGILQPEPWDGPEGILLYRFVRK